MESSPMPHRKRESCDWTQQAAANTQFSTKNIGCKESARDPPTGWKTPRDPIAIPLSDFKIYCSSKCWFAVEGVTKVGRCHSVDDSGRDKTLCNEPHYCVMPHTSTTAVDNVG